MGSVFIIKGILIYIYGFDHNPPHIHVESASGEFTITIKDRIVEGKGKAKEIKIINEFIDEHEEELLEIFEKAQRGEPIKKIHR
jgi:DNA-binding protein YbaB